MSWQPLASLDRKRLEEFLRQDEPSCVPLSSRLRSGERGCAVFVDVEGGTFSGCVMHTSRGLLLPVVPSGTRDNQGMMAVLRGLRPTVHSIMGTEQSVSRVETLMPLDPTTRIGYRLMRLDRRRWPGAAAMGSVEAAAAGVRISRASPDDALRLLELQRAYELEEVVVSPSLFSDSACLRLLRKALKDELVLFADRDGVPVAKAGTNARGWGADQIGGVFTTPAERGRGIARVVVAALLDEIFGEKEAACLFVKHANAPAIALYERLGFTTAGGYTISYYGI